MHVPDMGDDDEASALDVSLPDRGVELLELLISASR